MVDVVTYQAHITHSLKVPNWLGYVILPDGSMWGVRFEGETEEVVRANAVATYEREKSKWSRLEGESEAVTEWPKPNGDGRGKHLIGTVCMIHHAMKKRIRCAAAEVNKFEADGWVRGGPRTQFEG